MDKPGVQRVYLKTILGHDTGDHVTVKIEAKHFESLAKTATFKDDFEVILNIANSDRQQKAIDNFIKEKQAITYIKLDDLFKQCNFEREGWIK